MKYRIWTDGEGLSWSTITDLLGQDDQTETKLQNLTLDLTDTLFEKCKKLEMIKKEIAELREEIDFLKGNIGSCINFGRKRLNYEGMVKYIHDREAKTVSIEIINEEILIKEQNLTFLTFNSKSID